MNETMKKAYLVLNNGDVFEGTRFGSTGDTLGELVFTTGMCGYIETLTDPSYFGQIVLQTFPLIGNYGMIDADFESKSSAVKGYIVREWCDTPSNFRENGDLNSYLKKQGIIGLYGLDTREITRIIREYGVMNAIICDEIPDDKSALSNYIVKDAVSSVSTKESMVFHPQDDKGLKVTLIDYGAKQNIVRELLKRGCTVTVVPHNTSAEEILSGNPNGIMLSNGPGDPEENVYPIEQLQKLIGKIPMFGICLGHQLLALASGGKTMKLKYGHRGVNQPVKDLKTGRTYITSQNHGYAVVSDSLVNCGAELRYINANDNTCEGIDYEQNKAFSVQFHPEACSGPLDTSFLFDRFIELMSL